MKKAVIGIVHTLPQAENLVDELQRAGFTAQGISVMMPSESGTSKFAAEHGTKSAEGAIAGVGVGGVVGGTLGLLAGIGALAIPGLGAFIAAGPLMAALSGAAAGAAAGGFVGTLVGMGIPEYEARLYENKVRRGNMLVAVHTEDAAMRDRAQKIFKGAGADDVSSITESTAPKSAPDTPYRAR